MPVHVTPPAAACDSAALALGRAACLPSAALRGCPHPPLPQCPYQLLAFVPPSNGTPSAAGAAVAVAVDAQHPLTLLLNGSVGDRELCR